MKKMLATLMVMLVLAAACTALAVPAFAAPSNQGTLLYKVEVYTFSTGSSQNMTYVTQGDTVKVSSTANSKYYFTGWAISGKYEIVSGSLTSKDLVIRPLSDVVVEAAYDVEGSQGFGKGNSSDKSPVTGDALAMFAGLITVAGVSVMLMSRKPIAE